jgi:hypothetical protein
MNEFLKALHPGGFEPGIFCSVGGRNDHSTTPPGHSNNNVDSQKHKMQMYPEPKICPRFDHFAGNHWRLVPGVIGVHARLCICGSLVFANYVTVMKFLLLPPRKKRTPQTSKKLVFPFHPFSAAVSHRNPTEKRHFKYVPYVGTYVVCSLSWSQTSHKPETFHSMVSFASCACTHMKWLLKFALDWQKSVSSLSSVVSYCCSDYLLASLAFRLLLLPLLLPTIFPHCHDSFFPRKPGVKRRWTFATYILT